MSARILPSTGRAAAENQLLAQLGLPPSSSPEDVDALHQAVSEFLAGAPSSIRGWAHAQAAALDTAYLTLTDPVGLEGSALRSPTSPPAVVPGGPATPPARRDSVPATTTADDALEAKVAPVETIETAEATDADADFDALYASVTPSAHQDMGPDKARKAARRTTKAAPIAAAAAPVSAPAAATGGLWKKLVLGGVAIAAAVAIAVGGYALGGGGAAAGANGSAGQAEPSAPAVDMAKIGALMEKLQANPKDTATLLALADEYYAGEQYDTANGFLDKLLAIDSGNIQALLAKGAISFNQGDMAGAEKTWKQVAAIQPENQEVHYDLGFLYLNQATPDWAGVQREWTKVVAIDSTTSLAQTVQQHLDSLASSSMIPGGSPAASPPASPAAGAAAPAASPAASPIASPIASPAASTRP